MEDLTNDKLDAWALGVTLFELFAPNKKGPYWVQNWVPGKGLPLICSLTQESVDVECQKLPREIQPLIKDLLQVDPKKRLSAQMALKNYGHLLN